jgi:DNA-binding MarR family transcriptional regulator
VRLTERGRAVDEAVRLVIERMEVEWAARLGEDEYRELTRLLRALIAMLEQSPHGA